MKQRSDITTEDIFRTVKEARESLIETRSKLRIDYIIPEPSQIFDGGMTCILSAMHNTLEQYRDALRQQRSGISMNPRGTGADSGQCLYCYKSGMFSNFSSFVRSKEDGSAIVSMFARHGLNAHLDFRDFEPNWIQVKVQGCPDHSHILQPLARSIAYYGFITDDMLEAAIVEHETADA